MFSSLFRPLVWLTASLSVLATILAVSTYRNTAASAEVPPVPAAKEENPTVKPGLVNWHPSFAAAQTAAQKSGKPVLLFHMMGQLDKQYC